MSVHTRTGERPPCIRVTIVLISQHLNKFTIRPPLKINAYTHITRVTFHRSIILVTYVRQERGEAENGSINQIKRSRHVNTVFLPYAIRSSITSRTCGEEKNITDDINESARIYMQTQTHTHVCTYRIYFILSLLFSLSLSFSYTVFTQLMTTKHLVIAFSRFIYRQSKRASQILLYIKDIKYKTKLLFSFPRKVDTENAPSTHASFEEVLLFSRDMKMRARFISTARRPRSVSLSFYTISLRTELDAISRLSSDIAKIIFHQNR